MRGLIDTRRRFGLTPEEITSRFDWLETIMQNSAQTSRNTKAYILKSLDAQKGGKAGK